MAKAVYRLSLDLPTTLVAKLDAAARARGQTRTGLTRNILEMWADRMPEPAPAPFIPPDVKSSWDVTL